MIIIGADYHPGFQQIAFVDTDTGELQERRLEHREEAETFYRDLATQGMRVRVGMEASGHARWFERLLAELQFELWIGDAAEIRTKRVRKQKTDRQDAQLILQLLLEERFPRIWVPSWENRDLLELLDRLTPTIAELTQAIEQEVEQCPEAQRLQTHPGVGALTALAFVLIIGRADRFQCGKQIASYLGLVPLEESSGQRRRLGHITKQGNSLMRFLLVEAAQVTVRSDQEWRSKYFHLAMRRGRKIAKVAMARRLAVRMYWMWRKGWDYEQLKKFGSHAGQPGNRDGVR